VLGRQFSQTPRRQGDQGPYEIQKCAHSNPKDPKRKEEQPHYGIKYQCKDRQRPTENEKNTPKEEFCHAYLISLIGYSMLSTKDVYGQNRKNVLSHFHETSWIEGPAEKDSLWTG
jgi:hypothetical protein